MINGIYILDEHGAVLLRHAHLTNVLLSTIQLYVPKILQKSEPQLLSVSAQELMYTRKYRNMHFLLLCDVEAPIIEVEELLNQFITAVESYFEVKFSQTLLSNNKATIILIYAEMLDTGVPRIVEPDILRLLVQENSVFTKMFQPESPAISSTNTAHNNAQTPYELLWRRSDVKHANEEILVDILEHVEAMHGTSPVIQGEVLLKSRLGGVPEVCIELSHSCHHFRFHRAVDVAAFHASNDRVIKLTPADGLSKVAAYAGAARERFLVHANTKHNANGSFTLHLSTPIDRSIENVSDLRAVVVFPDGVRLVKELSSTSGNFSVADPLACELTFDKLTPTGWKSSLTAQATDAQGQSVLPLFVEVSYWAQGKCLSGIQVKGIHVDNKRATASKSYKGVRYRQFVKSVVK